jgi:hypothetical protein
LTSQRTLQPDDDEDTIELELTVEEMRGLSSAARQAYAPRAGFSSKALRALGRRIFRAWPVALVAALVGVAAAISWRPSPPHRIVAQPAPLPAVPGKAAAIPQPVVLAPPPEAVTPGPPVRVRNPFDATEIFEFPAGTTRAEARQKVAQVLLQRAVDRDGAVNEAQPAHNDHAADR